MNPLYRDAILKASQVRKQLGINMFQPLNIFDVCLSLGITVKFVDVNMEGLYIKQGKESTILISTQRPFARRYFTCGHELGHYAFGHGLKVDILLEENTGATEVKDKDEILVDAFSAAFIMPVGGVLAQFAKRDWNIAGANPLQFYTISSVFNVGYQTLITHCKVNALISEQQASALSKLTPAKLFKNYFGIVDDKSHFKIVDNFFQSTVDLEVGNYVALPIDFIPEEGYLELVLNSTEDVYVYRAVKAGIFTVAASSGNSLFVRVQKQNYIGFADYRHFED